MERGVLVQTGSWPCENFSGRATRRNISEQLHLWESNHTAHARFDALLENCVFYISRMYEFLHSQSQNEKVSQRAFLDRCTPQSRHCSARLARQKGAMTRHFLVRECSNTGGCIDHGLLTAAQCRA